MRRRGRGTAAAAGALMLLLCAPAAASAATRFASPTGTASATCAAATPCDIATAINSAAAGDTVLVLAGVYGSPDAPIGVTLTDSGNPITVEGAGIGATAPVIYDSAQTVWSGAGTVVENLDLVGDTNVKVPNGLGPVTITRVFVKDTAANGVACNLSGPFTISDSICWASGGGTTGDGIQTGFVGGGTVRNVTAVGTHTGLAAVSSAQAVTETIVNSILSGGQHDISADSLGAPLTIELDHSDFSSISNSGATINQTATVSAAPQFVAAAAGDFRELPSSPTVDAGVDDPANGSFDQDGNPRQQGAATDTGAYEFVPATPVACSASALIGEIGTLNAGKGGTISLPSGGCTIDLTTVDNYWYGPNALPAISSPITIEGNGATLERSNAAGTPAMRLFFVGADPSATPTFNFVSPGAGSLALEDLTLANGSQHGGDAHAGGGGGAGMGGAIFNMGTLSLQADTLTGNSVQGGNACACPNDAGRSGGGIGSAAGDSTGGGFGGTITGATISTGSSSAGGGGGGFRTDDNATGAAGGGVETDFGGGGNGNPGGDGSGGGFGAGAAGTGANFGQGADLGGGGGVGGGGGNFSGGGFGGGGGGGSFGGAGGFGGGGGGGGGQGAGPGGGGGFGGGSGNSDATNFSGGGGAGMGGAVFNVFGSVTLANTTFAGNSAAAGTADFGDPGEGLGGAVFNVDGSLSVSNSTFDANVAPDGGGAIYSLGYGMDAARAADQPATAEITNSILSGSVDSAGGAVPDLVSDQPATVANGSTNDGTSTATATGPNIIVSGSIAGTAPLTADPRLAAPADNGGPGMKTEMPGPTSPALGAGTCALPSDERGFPRPGSAGLPCDLGAVQHGPVCAPESELTKAATAVAIQLSCDRLAGGYAIVAPPSHGAISGLNAGTGALTYTPSAGYHGPDAFTYKASNSDGASNVATVTLTVADPPSVSITTPADGATYIQGQSVKAAYSCTEGADGPGLQPGSAGCTAPVADGSAIDTSTLGAHAFAVVATSTDTFSTQKQVSYTVIEPPPSSTAPPQITGTPDPGQTLSCSTGSWSNHPTGYAYQWQRDGAGIAGVVSSTYAVQPSDEGDALRCQVTASNAAGPSAPRTSNEVTVALVAPHSSTPPTIGGTAKKGQTLTCSAGGWSDNLASFTYQWYRYGTPIQGATGSTYTVQRLDEGTTLTCTVTASDHGGTATATSNPFEIPVPFVRGCPAAAGRLSGIRLGRARLGMTHRQAHRAYEHSSRRGSRYTDFFCLTPYGVRVGYASPKLLKTVSKRDRRKLAGRVVWISTGNAHYAVKGIRVGATLKAAEMSLKHGYSFRVGKNRWYLAGAGGATAVLKVRHDMVEEIGIADKALTRSHRADRILMASFRWVASLGRYAARSTISGVPAGASAID